MRQDTPASPDPAREVCVVVIQKGAPVIRTAVTGKPKRPEIHLYGMQAVSQDADLHKLDKARFLPIHEDKPPSRFLIQNRAGGNGVIIGLQQRGAADHIETALPFLQCQAVP